MTPGHMLGHICLYDEEKQILFSGDHILGDITPVISISQAAEMGCHGRSGSHMLHLQERLLSGELVDGTYRFTVVG